MLGIEFEFELGEGEQARVTGKGSTAFTSGFLTNPFDPEPGAGRLGVAAPPRHPHAYRIAAKMPAQPHLLLRSGPT